jgi:hypothetical protein
MLNSLTSPQWGIPVVMPVTVVMGAEGARLLASGPTTEEPDYTVHALDEPAAMAALPATDPAARALDEIERAASASEYHDFEWWQARIATIRAALPR